MIANPFFRIAGEKTQGFGFLLGSFSFVIIFDWSDD